jgi:hypothetical protein
MACSSGRYAGIGETACAVCEPGQVATSEGSSKCDFCEPGKYVPPTKILIATR